MSTPPRGPREGLSVGELARTLGGRVVGDPDVVLQGVASLEDAGPGELSFFHRADYRSVAESSGAGCILVGDEDDLPGRTAIVTADPHRSFAAALRLFHPAVPFAPGIADGAFVAEDATVGAGSRLEPGAVVGPGARVGEGCRIASAVVIGEHAEVGDGCELHPGVVLYPGTVLGRRVVVHAGAVLGSDGFGYVSGPAGHEKVPHVGRVVVEDDVEIGAGTCVDRAVTGETRIGAGTKIDNLVQVGHNVRIGAGCLLVAQSGVSGSTELGAGAVLAGQSGVAGHLRVGAGARVAAKSAVLQDVDPGEAVGGIPAVALSSWKRTAAALRRLPGLLHRVRRLERGAAGQGRSVSDD